MAKIEKIAKSASKNRQNKKNHSYGATEDKKETLPQRRKKRKEPQF